jgi:hypothetical protein
MGSRFSALESPFQGQKHGYKDFGIPKVVIFIILK